MYVVVPIQMVLLRVSIVENVDVESQFFGTETGRHITTYFDGRH